jgi:hypothetical protein
MASMMPDGKETLSPFYVTARLTLASVGLVLLAERNAEHRDGEAEKQKP